MANSVPNPVYFGQPLAAPAGGQIFSNNGPGPLGRTLMGQASITLDGGTASGTINYIDGVNSFGKTIILPLQSVAASTQVVAALTLTAVAASSGGNAVYTGTITGGANSAFVGDYFTIAGFTNAADNGVFIAVASTATTLTLANPNAVAQTHAATATGGIAVYNSVFGDGQVKIGDSVVIAGFSNSVNNGTFTVVMVSSQSVTVNNTSAVAETNPAATLSDVQNGTPVAIYATTSTESAGTYLGIMTNVISSKSWTYVLSATGAASDTLLVNFILIFPGI